MNFTAFANDLRGGMIKVVESQLKDNDPPETRQAYDRLQDEGFSKDDILSMIGSLVAIELFNIFKNKEPFNYERYKTWLQDLPDMPWE